MRKYSLCWWPWMFPLSPFSFFSVSWWLELIISLWRPKFVSQLSNPNKNHKLHDKIQSQEKNWSRQAIADLMVRLLTTLTWSHRVLFASYAWKLAKKQQWVPTECPILVYYLAATRSVHCSLSATMWDALCQVALRSLEAVLEWQEVVFTMALHFQYGTVGWNSRIHRLGIHPNKLEKKNGTMWLQ